MKISLFLSALSALTLQFASASEPKAAKEISRDVTPEQAEQLLKQNPKTVIVDVRTPEEFASGHLAGAKNLDFQSDDFSAKVAALPADQPILLHCASGGRSQQALPLLLGRKFPELYHMNGGFAAWKKAGKPVEKK
jgi:rhodanese-related sulfurtransferase